MAARAVDGDAFTGREKNAELCATERIAAFACELEEGARLVRISRHTVPVETLQGERDTRVRHIRHAGALIELGSARRIGGPASADFEIPREGATGAWLVQIAPLFVRGTRGCGVTVRGEHGALVEARVRGTESAGTRVLIHGSSAVLRDVTAVLEELSATDAALSVSFCAGAVVRVGVAGELGGRAVEIDVRIFDGEQCVARLLLGGAELLGCGEKLCRELVELVAELAGLELRVSGEGRYSGLSIGNGVDRGGQAVIRDFARPNVFQSAATGTVRFSGALLQLGGGRWIGASFGDRCGRRRCGGNRRRLIDGRSGGMRAGSKTGHDDEGNETSAHSR